MAERDLLDQLQAQGIVDKADAQRIVDDLNNLRLNKPLSQDSPHLGATVTTSNPLPKSIKLVPQGERKNEEAESKAQTD